jgi:hypothetical protein
MWEHVPSRGRARAEVARTRPAKMLEERMVIVLGVVFDEDLV